MKYANTLSRRIAFLHTIALTVLLLAGRSLANPFDDGTLNTVTNDTDFGSGLYVGSENPDNTLMVSNSATVKAQRVTIGEFEASTNNLLSIAGDSLLLAGTSDTNGLTTGGIVVGDSDGKPAITVNHASTLEGEYLYLGLGTNDSASMKLDGELTKVNIAQDAYVGYAGSTNTLDIGAGANLSVGNMLTVGSLSGSNNHVNVSGTLSVGSTNNIQVVEQEEYKNGIIVKSGGTLQVRGDVDTETLEGLGVDMRNRSTVELDGNLTLEDNQLDSGYSAILNNGLSTNNVATWDVSTGTFVHIGNTTSDNTLTLTNGATGFSSLGMRIGTTAPADRNALTLGGKGTEFISEKNVLVGGAGSDNTLNVTDSAELSIYGSIVLGKDSSSLGNAVNVGSNSVLSVGGGIVVGANGENNSFNIDQGVVSVTNDFVIGAASTNNHYLQTEGTNTVTGNFIVGEKEEATGSTYESTGNLAEVVGTNAILNIQQDLIVGQEGGGSILNIRDGVVNVAGDAIIGQAVGENYIFLEKDYPESRLNIAGDLIVGVEGGDTRFSIYGGVTDVGGSLYLGASTNQHESKNYIHLETTNALLNVADAIHIGASNSINTFDLVMGAEAAAQDVLVGGYEGTTNNTVTIRGRNNNGQYVAGSLLSVSNQLTIGSSTGSNNTVNVNDGGILYVSAQTNIVLGAATNNTLKVADQGTLKTHDWNFAAQTNLATNIVFEAGSTLHLLGALAGTNMIEGGLNVVLDEAGASWDTGTNNMYIGNTTANNSLTITNGAMAATATNLYIGFFSDKNSVTVGGGGSLLDIGHNLFIGNTETNNSAFNTLFVTDSGLVTVGNDLVNAQGGTLKIGAGAQVHVSGNYEQKYNEEFGVASRLEVGVSSNAAPPSLEVEGTANFEEQTTIAVYDDGVYGNTNVVQTIVLADEIMIGDQAATTGLLYDRLNIESNSLLNFDVTVSNNMIIVDNFIVLDIGDELDLDSQLLAVASELIGMATNGNELAQAWKKTIEGLSAEDGKQAMDNYYGEKASSIPLHNVINQGIGGMASRLTVRGDNTRERMNGADAPAGAMGPHTQDQDLQGWIAGYTSRGDRSADDGFGAYDADLNGFMIGADLAVSRNILVGLAGGSNSGSVDKANGASGDTKTTVGAVYTSVGTKDWFMDGSVIFGTSSIDNKLGNVFDTTASYDAQNLAFYLGGGKEIIGKYLIITPQASLLVNYYEQDAYDEKSGDTVSRSVDSFDALYLQSSLGCDLGIYMAMGEVTLKPEVRAHWLHEFNGDDEALSYRLIGGDGSSHSMLLQAPVSDVIKLGVGVAAKLTENLELRVDLDTHQASSYSDYTAFGSLRYQF